MRVSDISDGFFKSESSIKTSHEKQKDVKRESIQKSTNTHFNLLKYF